VSDAPRRRCPLRIVNRVSAARSALVPLLALGLVIACATPETDNKTPEITYYRDVKPIFGTRCEGCHNAVGIGSFDLTTYALAKAMAGPIAAAVESRTMPPWMLSPGLPFRHERRLADAEIKTIRAWADAGAPEGDPKTEVLPTTTDIVAVDHDATIQMKGDYKPDLSLGADDYRCFVLDPQLDRDTAVVGFDITPGNRKMVHHVILYSVPATSDAQLARFEAEDAGEGYTCFGTSRADDENMVGAWVPGTSATAFPEGTGVVLEKGSKLVMQVHYNTLEVQDATDRTTAVLDYATNVTDVKPAYIFPILNSSFSVKAGEMKTVTSTFSANSIYRYLPAGAEIQILGVAPHMHLHGKSLTVSLTPPVGETTTLVDVAKWDFHWQQLYFYNDPVSLPKDATVTLACTFDNRQASQPWINGRQTEAKTLTWGEGTLDEMCLNFFYATVK
jgi:hypothetical protein